jgi:hypothetical protein
VNTSDTLTITTLAAQLVALEQDVATWREIARQAIHFTRAQHERVESLTAQLAALRDEFRARSGA